MRTVHDHTDRTDEQGGATGAVAAAAPWALLSPYEKDAAVGLGWVIDSLSDVRSGAATLALRHEQYGVARVAIRRNGGVPLGVAHTDDLDFMLMNGGGGAAPTEESLGRVLRYLAKTLAARGRADEAALESLRRHGDDSDRQPSAAGSAHAVAGSSASKRIAPAVDKGQGMVSFTIEDSGGSRLALDAALLAFAGTCDVSLTRPDAAHIVVHLKLRPGHHADALKQLVRDATIAVNQAVRGTSKTPGAKQSARESFPSGALGAGRRAGGAETATAPLSAPALEAIIADLESADPATVGLGFASRRGPGHEHLRVLNVRGAGACNSECVFCVEKFSPVHRAMPKVDATRDFILQSAGDFDMLFFASGEPTIHPKIFEHVALARSVGFTSFGMSSHFRTFSDPRFALKTLRAGFQYFDISLHAADAVTQLDVNPIDDGGTSLFEALKGLAVLYRLAEALQIRISVSHKIVVSKLNVTRLEEIFRATYDRGVRNFILQPVRTEDLAPELQAKLAIPESDILPYLNDFLRQTESLDAIVKPYGFSRTHLYAGRHVEHEQNRVKNIYGLVRSTAPPRRLPASDDARPTDGRHWVELKMWEGVVRFASPENPVLLDQGLARGLALPFGCRMGSCGMCCARLVKGRVDQSTQNFLDADQLAQGFVLLCQAHPQSDLVLEMCSDEEIDRL